MTTPEKRADLMATMELIEAEEADAYNWTADELAIMREGGSVSVVVNGTTFEARMLSDQAPNDKAWIDWAYECKAHMKKIYGW